MEGRLYELIRDYQRERAAISGAPLRTFRLRSIRSYAAKYPSRYPEYVADPERLLIAVQVARKAGEILPAFVGRRDDVLSLRIDANSSER